MTGALLIAVGVIGYALFVLASPHHRCPKCKGERVVHKGHRAARCKRCKAEGIVRRPGARLVHSLYWAVAGDAHRERLRNRSDQEEQ